MEKLAKVIAIGHGGIKIVENFESHNFVGNVHYSTLAIETRQETLDETSIENKILLETKTCEKAMTIDSVTNGRMILECNIGNVTKLIGKCDYAVLVAGFGGEFSAGITSALAEVLDNMGITVLCYITKPFDFEGERRLGRYLEGVTFLVVEKILYNETVLSEIMPKGKITLANMFKIADKAVYEKILQLFMIES